MFTTARELLRLLVLVFPGMQEGFQSVPMSRDRTLAPSKLPVPVPSTYTFLALKDNIIEGQDSYDFSGTSI